MVHPTMSRQQAAFREEFRTCIACAHELGANTTPSLALGGSFRPASAPR